MNTITTLFRYFGSYCQLPKYRNAVWHLGNASGENKAVDAAKSAINSPLLETSIDGAKGIVFTVTGGASLSMNEVNEATKVVTESTDPNAVIIFGAVIDPNMKDEIKVTVVATGFDDNGVPEKKCFCIRN